MRRLEAWLLAPGDPRALALLRAGLCAALALSLATGPYLDLARQPAALYRPISFMRLLDAMPPPEVVLSLQVLGTAAAALAALGLATRLTLPLAWAVAVPLIAMTSSLGKVVHNDVLLLLCLVPLLPARTADAWSVSTLHRSVPAPGWRYGWPLRTAMVVVAGAYFFSGLAKLFHAGIGWVTSDSMRWILYASSDSQARPNDLALFVADRPWLAHLVAAATLAVELGFPLLLWRAWLAWLWLPAVVAMHAGIWLAMRLDYWPMAFTAVLVYAAGPAVATLATRRPGRDGRPQPSTAEANTTRLSR